MTQLVVGAPAWDRAWALPLWFESLRANVDPSSTGLVFVIPASDTPTREIVAELSRDFDWVEVMRDRGDQLTREERPALRHQTLAAARNQILSVVAKAQPERFLSWDTDLLVPPGTVERLTAENLPVVTCWTWLNRQAPRRMQWFDGERMDEVLWQPPVCATAMAWDPRNAERAVHYPSSEFGLRSQGIWRCDVALAWQLMDRRAYGVAHYRPHHDGEDIPFAMQLAQRGVPQFCCGEIRGVHLYDRSARDETALGWPDVMGLARQIPLAAHWTEPRSTEHEAFGFFPIEERTDEHRDRSTEAA